MSTLPHVHPDDILRLQTIRSQIEALEDRHVEDMTNEYNVKVCKLERSISDARVKLDSVEKEIATSPTVSDDKTRELDEARKAFNRLSSETEESKNASVALKGDLAVLQRLRKDEAQLLKAIFSQPEWQGLDTLRAQYDELNNIQGDLNSYQHQVAIMNTARVLVEMTAKNMSACRESLAQGQEEVCRRHLNAGQEHLIKSVEAYPELKSLIDCASFSQDVPREMLESTVATMEQCAHRAHSHVLETLHATQEAKMDQEEKLYEKQHDLLRLQRGLVLSQ